MLPMSVKQVMQRYVKPHVTKETKSTVSASFQTEDGTVRFGLEPKIGNDGKPEIIDLNNTDEVVACKVKTVSQSVKNPNVALGQSLSKLAPTINVGFKELLEHANTLAEPVTGN